MARTLETTEGQLLTDPRPSAKTATATAVFTALVGGVSQYRDIVFDRPMPNAAWQIGTVMSPALAAAVILTISNKTTTGCRVTVTAAGSIAGTSTVQVNATP